MQVAPSTRMPSALPGLVLLMLLMLLMLLGLLGCAGGGGGAGGGGVVRDLARTAADLERERPAPLAEELLEGERAAMRTDVEALNARIDRAIESRARVEAFDLLRWAVALEVSDPSCAFECERRLLYLYDALASLHTNHFAFSTSAQNDETALYDRMLARTAGRARWAIGRVLSGTRDKAIVSLTLQRLAGRERDEGHLERARYYLEWSLAIEPSAARHAALGGLCYRLGDLACGDRELHALAGDSETASLERLRNAARAAVAPGTTIDALLGRAEALAILQRDDEAIALYERLAHDHPDDARPHVGRAQMVFLDIANLGDPIAGGLRAGLHLDRAAHLRHREARYYELATIVWGRRLFAAESLVQASREDLTTRLAEIVTGFRAIDPATASAVELFGKMTLAWSGDSEVTVPSRADVLTLRNRYPQSAHLYRLSLLLAIAGEQRPAAEAFGRFPGEAGALERAQIVAALGWEDPALLPGELPNDEAGAVALALRARHGLAPWAEVADRYRALLEHADAGSSPRLRDGLAVALWWAGDRDGARAVFAELTGPAPELNSLATADASARDAAWLRRLETLRSVDDSGIACGAARLLRAAGALADAETRAACQDPNAALLERSGIMSSGLTFNFAFSFSSRTGFESSFVTRVEPWLLVSP